MPAASGSPCSGRKRTADVATTPAGSHSSASAQNPRLPPDLRFSMPYPYSRRAADQPRDPPFAKAELVTDDAKALHDQLEAVIGERIAALEAVEPAADKSRPKEDGK